MALHPSTFQYLKPTDAQMEKMNVLRQLFADHAHAVDTLLPEGPDKTYLLRRIRENAMWANVAVTREADGTPRA